MKLLSSLAQTSNFDYFTFYRSALLAWTFLLLQKVLLFQTSVFLHSNTEPTPPA
jgi:hypothetical protein